METIIVDYISHELISRPELLPLKNESSLLESGILESLSILKLVLFMEEQFSITVVPEDLIPANFETVDAICAFLRNQQRLQEV
jgi:acyl carrier protein